MKKKSEVIKEGYIAGLKQAKKVITEMLTQGIGTGDATREWFKLFASEQRDLAEAEGLLKSGVDINARDSYGRTALMLTVFVLVEDIDEDDDVLSWDAERLPVVKWLIENGADVNAAQDNGFTPLMAAACAGFIRVAYALMLAGADAEVEDANDMNAIAYAEEYCPSVSFEEMYLTLTGYL